MPKRVSVQEATQQILGERQTSVKGASTLEEEKYSENENLRFRSIQSSENGKIGLAEGLCHSLHQIQICSTQKPNNQ